MTSELNTAKAAVIAANNDTNILAAMKVALLDNAVPEAAKSLIKAAITEHENLTAQLAKPIESIDTSPHTFKALLGDSIRHFINTGKVFTGKQVMTKAVELAKPFSDTTLANKTANNDFYRHEGLLLEWFCRAGYIRQCTGGYMAYSGKGKGK